ncbi:hypothetical protein Sxan_75550 [Streptomyces xanthophaeus]|uniref:Uncharacterized protein n=2 Tax=Streptomyces xanthophaeus TaxID=67385 RepID=A0A919H8R5_9ACTN|nr:hypothetical protein Sxan_75550 [Streptomyces xanthophaeus]
MRALGRCVSVKAVLDPRRNGGSTMAKNKNQKQPSKQQSRPAGQDPSKSSQETSSESLSPSPSPLDMAHKTKQKKFGHN